MKRFNAKYAPFWYHPDHLGSSSYITNLAGEINQHMEYLPFGELLVEEHLNSYNSPFKFNAKEFDAETGNYYYGARYYSPKYNLMLSVDQMYDLYPSFSPYACTLQNPVRYVDPTGMTAEDYDDRYKLLDNGKIEYYDSKGGDKVDYLIDSDGNEIELNDTTILPQLESQSIQEAAYYDKNVTLTGSYAESDNHSEMRTLYDWIASRNENEWSYVKGKNKDGVFSFIGTLRNKDQAPSPKGEYETLIDIHSHFGTALYDFQPSGNDRIHAQTQRKKNPNAQFFIFSPLLNKENYNKAVEGKYMQPNIPYKKIDYEPSKFIPY